MKSQITGLLLLSMVFVFVFSFGNIAEIKEISASVSYTNPAENEFETLASVLGTVYYVRSDGSNGNAGTGPSSGEAWATIDFAASQISPGDIVYVKPGTYEETVTISDSESGAEELPIQYVADKDGSVFACDPGNVTIDGGYNCIKLEGGDYIQFKNFKLMSCSEHGIYVTGDSHHNSFEGFEISSVGTSAIYLDGTDGSDNTRYTTITDCTITGDAYGVYLKDYSPYCVINGCEISGFSNTGIYIETDCDNCTVSKCKISNSSTSTYGIYINESDNCSFENNFVYGFYSAAAVYDKDNDDISWNFNSVLNNETTAGNGYGYHANRSGAFNASSFRDNIIEVTDTSNCYVMYIEGTGSNWLPDNLDYNDFFGGSTMGYYDAAMTFAGWQTATTKDANSITDNPQFTSSTNLYLQPDSPCLGKGTSISGITEDIDGDERNSDGHPCIGADEMQTLEVGTPLTINWNFTIGDVTVISGGSLTLASAQFNLGDITVESGGVLVITDEANVECGDVSIEEGGTITFDGTTNEVFLSSNGHFDIQVNSTANIQGLVTIRAKQGTIGSLLDGEGEAGVSGSGAGSDIDISTTPTNSPSGAGHGGNGGNGINTTGGSGYGDIIDPFEVGSKGGDVKNGANVVEAGGYGGASIKLFVSGTLTLNAAIEMNGADGSCGVGQSNSSAGGSGGSVFISAGIITGSGTISADGGEAPDADYQGGGASAGRIVILSGNESSWTSTISVSGGLGVNTGDNGTKLKHEVENDNGICLNCGTASTVKDTAFSNIEAANQAQSWIHTSATGGLSFEQQMISLSGPGPNPSVSIYYNSNETSTIPSSLQTLGVGWNHTFNQYLIVNDDIQGDRDTVSWHRPCGQRFTFWDVDGDTTEDYTCIPVYGLNSEVEYDTLTGGSATIEELYETSIDSGDSAVDKGSQVGLPITNQPFSTGDVIVISGTVYYNGIFTIVSSSTNEIVITATYQAEMFGAGALVELCIPGRAYSGWVLTTGYKKFYFKDFDEIDGLSIALLDTIVDNFDRRITLEYTDTQLTYVQDSLDQSNDNTEWRRIYFTYTSGLITKIEAKYWASGGTQITGKERNITYNGSDLLETAGVSTSDWHWKYTYDGNNITKRDIWFDTSSTGYYVEYVYTGTRVASSRVGGEDIYLELAYTDSTGKVEIDGRQYDDENRMEWSHYTDSVYHGKVEDQMLFTDGVTILNVANRKFDSFNNVIEFTNVNGLKTVLSFKDKTNSLETTTVYDVTTIMSYSENVYDADLNIIASYGPCKTSTPNISLSPLKETKVVYNFDNTTYQSKHLVRYVRKYTSDSTFFQTEYAYAVVPGQQTVDNYYQLDYTIANNQSGTATTDQLKTDYTYYSETNVAVGVIKGFVSQINKDDAAGSLVHITTKYRNYISGALKETTNPMGITSQYIYDTSGFGRTLGQCNDADHAVDITSITQYPSTTKIQVHTSIAHGLSSGDAIRLLGTNIYDASYTVDSIVDSDDFVINFTYTSDVSSTTALVIKNSTGLEQGSITVYHENGLIDYTQSGAFSNWDQTAGTYTVDTSEAYSQSEFMFDSTYGRMKATRGRDLGSSDFRGSTYEYFGNGALDESKSGKIIDWSTTPSIYTSSVNYSHNRSIYYCNGWLKRSEKLISGDNFATVENFYNEDGSTYYTKGPKYGDNDVDIHETYQYYDVLGRNIRTSTKVGVGQWSNSLTVYDNEYFRVYQSMQEKTEGDYYTTTYTYAEEAATPVYYTNRVIKTTAPGGYETEYTHDNYGRVIMTEHAAQSTSGEEVFSYKEYDILGRKTQTWISDSSSTSFANGKKKVEYSYNRAGAVYNTKFYDISHTNGTGSTYFDSNKQVIYDALGRPKAESTDITNSSYYEGTEYTYDTLGREQYDKTVKFGTTWTSSDSHYWAASDPGYSIDTTYKSVRSEYDEASRKVKSIVNYTGSPSDKWDDVTTYFEYDEIGCRVFHNDPQQWFDNTRAKNTNQYRSWVYNNARMMVEEKVKIGEGSTPVYTEYTIQKSDYYNDGKLKTKQYTQNGSTYYDFSYSYYPSGLLSSTIDQQDNIATNEYNLAGQLMSKTDAEDQTINYEYDDFGKIQYIDDDGDVSRDTEIVYNDLGQITTIKNYGGSNLMEFNYNDLGWCNNVKDMTAFASGRNVHYDFYNSGLRMDMQADYTDTPSNIYKVKYVYDKSQRLFELYRDDSGYEKIADWSFDGAGNLASSKKYDNTSEVVYSEYSYLANIGHLTKIRNLDNSTSQNNISTIEYYNSTVGDGHDLLGNITYYEIDTGANNDYKVTYDYDDLYRLTEEDRNDGSNNDVYRYTWAYDLTNNRTTQKEFDSSDTEVGYWVYTYNNLNQMTDEDKDTSESGGTNVYDTTYTWNDIGNLVDKVIDYTDPMVDDIRWVYGYDYYNRLVDVDMGVGGADPSQLAAYTYNYKNNRVEEVAGSTIRYLYDGSTCVGDWTVSGATETLRNYYIDKILINVASGGTPNTDYFTTYGRFNSISEIVNTSSAVQNQYYYKAFGEEYNTTINVTQPFSWQSTPYDSNTGLYNHDNLDIDPLIGNCFERFPLLHPQINPGYLLFDIYHTTGDNLFSIGIESEEDPYPYPKERKSWEWCDPLDVVLSKYPQKWRRCFDYYKDRFYLQYPYRGNDSRKCVLKCYTAMKTLMVYKPDPDTSRNWSEVWRYEYIDNYTHITQYSKILEEYWGIFNKKLLDFTADLKPGFVSPDSSQFYFGVEVYGDHIYRFVFEYLLTDEEKKNLTDMLIHIDIKAVFQGNVSDYPIETYYYWQFNEYKDMQNPRNDIKGQNVIDYLYMLAKQLEARTRREFDNLPTEY